MDTGQAAASDKTPEEITSDLNTPPISAGTKLNLLAASSVYRILTSACRMEGTGHELKGCSRLGYVE